MELRGGSEVFKFLAGVFSLDQESKPELEFFAPS